MARIAVVGSLIAGDSPFDAISTKNPKHEGRVLLHGSFVADAYRLPQSIHVERALELGVADADAVRLILEHRWEQPVGLFCLDGRPHLQVVAVPAPDLSVYASLTAGVAL